MTLPINALNEEFSNLVGALESSWATARAGWNDSVAERFEELYMEPLRKILSETKGVLGQTLALSEELDRILTD